MSGTEASNANPSVNKTCISCLPFTGDCEAAVALYKVCSPVSLFRPILNRHHRLFHAAGTKHGDLCAAMPTDVYWIHL